MARARIMALRTTRLTYALGDEHERSLEQHFACGETRVSAEIATKSDCNQNDDTFALAST